MYDYHRSDLTDKLYLRYLESYALTKETIETTGKSAYDFIQQVYTRNLRADLKIIDDDMKHYRTFKKKEFKHLLKLEKIGFVPISDTEYLKRSRWERRRYKRKESRAKAEDKRFIKIERKFRQWIPLKVEEPVKKEDVKKTENSIEVFKTCFVDEATKLLSGPKPKITLEELSRIVSGEVKENDVEPEGASEPAEEPEKKESEVKVGDTALSAKEELKKNGGIPLSEGTQMTLEAFFNTSNGEGKT